MVWLKIRTPNPQSAESKIHPHFWRRKKADTISQTFEVLVELKIQMPTRNLNKFNRLPTFLLFPTPSTQATTKKADPTSQPLKVAVSLEHTKSQPTNLHNLFNDTPTFRHLVSTTYTQARRNKRRSYFPNTQIGGSIEDTNANPEICTTYSMITHISSSSKKQKSAPPIP